MPRTCGSYNSKASSEIRGKDWPPNVRQGEKKRERETSVQPTMRSGEESEGISERGGAGSEGRKEKKGDYVGTLSYSVCKWEDSPRKVEKRIGEMGFALKNKRREIYFVQGKGGGRKRGAPLELVLRTGWGKKGSYARSTSGKAGGKDSH